MAADYLDRIRSMPVWDRYVYFVGERENVRVNKETFGGKPPWTGDPIIHGYRFCNMRRMDDKVSQWLLVNWYLPFKDHPNMLLAAAVARFINLPISLDRLTQVVFAGKVTDRAVTWNGDLIVKLLREYRDAGEGNTVFNGAYMVRGNDGMDKIDCVVNYYVEPLKAYLKQINPASMEETHATILQSFGMGSFMAGQIVADLRWGLTGQWKDRRMWAPIGPGSKRGMNRLYERDLGATISQIAFASNLLVLKQKVEPLFDPSFVGKMEAIDWQNTLCEFDKYERVLFGEGKPKQKYRP